MVGDSLVSVLRQLRAGYAHHPEVRFRRAWSLCGVRDVRDYRVHASSQKEVIAGGSAFDIKAKSLRLGAFTPRIEVDDTGRPAHGRDTGQDVCARNAAGRCGSRRAGSPGWSTHSR